MSSVEEETVAMKRGVANAVSASKEVHEPNRQKKRRLVLSDSDSDDCLFSLSKVDHRTDPNGDSSSIGEDNGVERMEEKGKVEVENKKRVLRPDFMKRNEELTVSDKKEVTKPELERSREPADAKVPAKKLEMDFSERGGGNNSEISKRKLLHGQDDTSDMEAEKDVGSKPLDPTSSKRDGLMENDTQTNSPRTSRREAEKDKPIESSGNQTLRMKHNSSSSANEKRPDTGMSQCKAGVLTLQGKNGVFRVSPSNKRADGLKNLHSKGKDEEKLKAVGSPKDSVRGTPNRPSISPDQGVHGKSSTGATFSKYQSRKAKMDKTEEIRSNRRKTKPVIVSPKREKKRTDKLKGRTGLKIKSRASSKAAFIAKQKLNEANVARSTEKQKLRDQIKNILLNAGWTIDLRPRKGRNYEDSVYIPPEGQSGYWSITKAYAAYQEQLTRACNERGKNSSGRSSRTSSGSDCVIPMESLNILKRIVVNKRRRREELEEAQRGKKKVKRTSDMRHARHQDTQDKLDDNRGRKKSNSALSSNTKIAVGSTVHKHVLKGRNKQRGCALLARGSNREAEAEDNDYVPYIWKRTVLSWMIDMGVLPINGKVKYMNQRKTKTKLEGQITRDGINCSCCSKILPMSEFELHAGRKLLQSSQYIFLEDGGVSLLQCQLDAWKKQDESERQGFYSVDVSGDDPNDDTCGICGDGGDLICCDGCPSTFHLSCLGIEKLPRGDWHCTNCCCRYCGGISTDATRERDGTASLLISCHQCEAKYHQGCVPDAKSVSAITKNLGMSFCAQSCRKVFKRLQKILGIKNDLEAGFSWSVIRRFDEDAPKTPLKSHLIAECNSKIAVALAVMDECFLPIIDQRSGVNLIRNVVYNCGSNFNRLNYRGFYSFILEHGDEIISVASIRIHGTKLAEMPFIGTRNMYRRQGMCRRLLDGIESALSSLDIEKLVIPAISELKDTWSNVFGFKPLEVSQELEVRSIKILVFPGTGLLQKPLLKMHSSVQYSAVDGVVNDIKHQHQTKSTHVSSEFSSIELNLHIPGQDVVHCINPNQDAEPSLSSSRVSPDSSGSPRSNCKPRENKISETAGDLCMHNFPEGGLAGSHDEDKCQVEFSTNQQAELTSELTLFDSHEGENVEANPSADLQECDSVSKQRYPDGFASDTKKSGSASLSMHPTEFNLLQHKLEDLCTSPGIDTFTLKQNVRMNVELPLGSLESTSTPSLQCHVTTKAHSPNSAESNDQVSSESAHDANHFEKSLMVHLEPCFLLSNEMMHSICKVKAKDSILDPKSSVNDGNSEPYAFEIVKRCLHVAATEESGASCSSVAVPDSDENARFSIQQSILDRVYVTNGTVCESNLSCVVKSCRIPSEANHSHMACSGMLDADIHDVQPNLTPINFVAADVLDKSHHICSEFTNGTESKNDELSFVQCIDDCSLHDASVDIKKFDLGSEPS
ncbi:PHD-finger [Musa troglodytarum]|uniref:PHD-finger n=1 Tax=Musa troglodytarum TaxID=320322 RepID=A0A9E7K4Q8_9LILI|nr:PHD-finger [Musa troglodytarum]URE04476.1 PHD-finger [Musa troglodytarum]URE04479.1 PHD-finger [Musa troglodytarum]